MHINERIGLQPSALKMASTHAVFQSGPPRVTYSSVIRASVEDLTRRSPYLLQQETEAKHPIALLDRSDLKLGELLGQGNFSNVYAVIGFHLNENRTITKQRPPLSSKRSFWTMKGIGAQILPLHESNKGGKNRKIQGDVSPIVDDQQCRELATKLKNGSSMYAVKCLKPELLEKSNPNAFLDAATDLVIEAKYLSKLDHPNILKVRGLPRGYEKAFANGEYDSFFILTDKLEETLNQRIKRWKRGEAFEENTLEQKLKIGLQVADALSYLADRNLVYRDLKPQNIGLVREKSTLVVKLFDFGFCRQLPTVNQTRDDTEDTIKTSGVSRLASGEAVFLMSGKGTRRYMAPEVLLRRPYNIKCDVYSWSMTFWELLTLHKPFYNYAKEQHAFFVCEEGERPPLDYASLWASPSFPSPSASLSSIRSVLSTDGEESINFQQVMTDPVRDLLRQAWHQDVSQRFTIKEVQDKLRGIIDSLGGDTRDVAKEHGGRHACYDGLRDAVKELATDIHDLSLLACLGYDAVKQPESIDSTEQVSVVPKHKVKQSDEVEEEGITIQSDIFGYPFQSFHAAPSIIPQ